MVGCSGGPDSQALLHALHALAPEHGWRLTAASVNHGLRAEAEAEVLVAGQLARALGVPFVALRVEVPAGASRQAAARNVRYAALHQCARAHDATHIAVGHTLDDQAETVLTRMLRGAGIEGLSATAPARADGVVRPLIDCPRALVHRYLAGTGVPFARDPSNRDARYLRVRVREQLLPALALENPKIAEHLGHLADDAREAVPLLRAHAERALANAGRRLASLQDEPPFVRRWALKLLVEREAGVSLTRAHLSALDRMLQRGGQVRIPGDVTVSVSTTGQLTFEPVAKRGRGIPRRNQETDTP